MKFIYIIIGLLIISAFGGVWYWNNNQFPIPKGESNQDTSLKEGLKKQINMTSQREILTTDGVLHSIPLDEILSGGPGKDGIPSIDNPSFISLKEADDFLNDSDVGVGLTLGGESRFYPYRILVWHEIVNDIIQRSPILVTYCPLCATGIVFDRRVDGNIQEFGVSGKLWQSNLLMYNRSGNEDNESLWSQVLGEAVLGIHTGKKLSVIRSDIALWKNWKKAHPDTKVLSQNTGSSRNYGRDPYGDYYSSDSVSFGASFSDTRLHPKTLVHGIEIDGKYKAYSDESITKETIDNFAGKTIKIIRTSSGGIQFEVDGNILPSIPGFWFSWLAVHPNTELYGTK